MAKVSREIIFGLLFFLFSQSSIANSNFKKVPTDFQLIDSFGEQILLGVNSQNGLVLFDVSSSKPVVLTKDPRASVNYLFHPEKPWFAYIETLPETFRQRLHVYDYKVGVEIFKSTPFILALFLDWFDSCRIVVGTTEEDPTQLYQFKIDPLCRPKSSKKNKTKSFWTLFSNGSPTNWSVDFGLETQKATQISMGSVYSTRSHLDENLVFTTNKGGIFVFSRTTGKIIAQKDKGYRPKLHPNQPWVLLEIPEVGFEVWDYRNNKTKTLKDIKGAQGFWGSSGIVYQDSKGISLYPLNWSEP